MTGKKLLKRLMLGALLATLPLAACFGLAELMVLFGIDLADAPTGLKQERRGWAAVVIVIGAALSLVAWCGLLLYAVSTFWEYHIRGRHERKLNDLRERGEIDF